MSDDKFTFSENGFNIFLIHQISTRKFLGSSSGGEVTKEDFKEDGSQLWRKGKPDAEGYFTLQNGKLTKTGPKFLTAISSGILQVKGNISLR